MSRRTTGDSRREVVLRRRGWSPGLGFHALWIAFWYGFSANWMVMIVQGNGHMVKGQPPGPTQLTDIIFWVVFLLFPLSYVWYFLWLLFGSERIFVSDGVLTIERDMFHRHAYPVRSYPLDSIERVVPSPAGPLWSTPNDMGPGSRGAVTIIRNGDKVRVARFLLGHEDEASELASTLNGWIGTPTPVGRV